MPPIPTTLDVVRAYPPLRLIAGSRDSRLTVVVRSVIICSIIPVILVLVTRAEGTWVLRGPGRGLGEHYGYWAFFITTPIVTFLTWSILVSWRTLLIEPRRYSAGDKLPTAIERLVEEHLESLALKTRLKYVLILFTIFGSYLILLNIRRTLEPLPTYGNDVFDSKAYPLSFVVGKIYLGLLYCGIYPSAVFVSLHVTGSLIFLLKRMCEEDVLRIDYFHPDNCGGVSEFGTVNLMIMALYASFALILLSLFRTHNYAQPVNAAPAFILSGLLIAQSTGAVYYIHRFVQVKKKSALRMINDQINARFIDMRKSRGFPNDLLAARNHILSVRTYPYATTASLLVNGLRFTPALLGLLRLLQPG